MAWQTPKTNWGAADVPLPDDFNRIEGNVQELQNTKETPAGAQAKANTAEANAKAYTDAHEQKAAPHSGHETPAGAQAKAEAAAGAVQAELDEHLAETATDGVHGLEALGAYKVPGDTVLISVLQEFEQAGYGSASASSGYNRILAFLAPYSGRYRFIGEIKATSTDSNGAAMILLAVAGAETNAQYYGPNYMATTQTFTTNSLEYVSFSLDMEFPVARFTPLMVMFYRNRYDTYFRNLKLCAIDGEPGTLPDVIYPLGGI